MMHPGIKVQFELDMQYGDAALSCKQCRRPLNPDSKHPDRLPPRLHPPLACGMTIFGGPNGFDEVAALAGARNASLVILLRRNHVAHAISAHLHFGRRRGAGGVAAEHVKVLWDARELSAQAQKMADGCGAAS